MERVGLETTTSPSTSHLQGALGPLVGSQKAGDSVQVEVMDQSLGDLAVKTGVESAMESLETYTGGLWTPKKVKGDFEAFKAHVLTQESVDERVHLVSLAGKSSGFSGSLRKRLRNLRFSLDPSKGRTELLSSGAQRGSKAEDRTARMATPFSRSNKRRKGPKYTPPEHMSPDRWQRRADGDESSMAQLADPLMGAVMDEGGPTKQLTKQQQVLISEAVDNEINKITEGVIPEFRDSFVKWGAVVLCAANEASRDWLRDRLPQRATLSILGKYDFPTIKAKLQRRCPDLGVEDWRLYACNSGGHGDAESTSVVVGQVRQNRIP